MRDAPTAHTRVSTDLSPARLIAGSAQRVSILGAPTVGASGGSVVFDGKRDGVLIPRLGEFAGATRFDVCVRVKPHPAGSFEQRFFHIQDSASNDRFLMEIRLDPDGSWYADSYFESGGTHALLQDPALRHASGVWTTYRVSYDGSELTQFVNGVRELSAPFPARRLPLVGVVSIGIRATREYPFCGEVGDVLIASW